MRRLTTTDPKAQSEEGFIIVAVLWILMTLAALATTYAAYVGNSALSLAANDATIETDALISAGVELTAYQLNGSKKDNRPSHGQFRTRIGNADITANYVSEAARIDLNAAPKPLLAGLFSVLGAASQDADRYADRIIGWRTAPKQGAADNESSLYRASGLSYGPRGGPFAHAKELWLIQGLPPALIERALPFLTVYSGLATVNIIDAPPEVIAALPDMTPSRLNGVLDRRETAPPGQASAEDILGSAQSAASTQASNAFRIDIAARFDNGRRTAAEVVIFLMEGGEQPYSVLAWDEVPERARSGGTR
jgi:general secretion pathway protein K